MELRQRLASIAANPDDLQTGVERVSRAADGVRRDAAALNGDHVPSGNDGDLLKSLAQNATDIEACANHQRGAMRELRQNIARLGRELNGLKLGL
jgi:hypothetical protein